MKLVKAYEARNSVELSIVRDTLENQGVKCVLKNMHTERLLGEIPMMGEQMPQLWVHEEDLEAAEEIIAEVAKQERRPSSVWTCRTCQETVEGHFGTCWNCGKDRY